MQIEVIQSTRDQTSHENMKSKCELDRFSNFTHSLGGELRNEFSQPVFLNGLKIVGVHHTLLQNPILVRR
jgi:hypothetical protein